MVKDSAPLTKGQIYLSLYNVTYTLYLNALIGLEY